MSTKAKIAERLLTVKSIVTLSLTIISPPCVSWGSWSRTSS